MSRHRKIRRDLDAPGPIGHGTRASGRRRGLHAGRPHDGARLDALGPSATSSRSQCGHAFAEPHLDAEVFQRPPRRLRQLRMKGGKQAGPASTRTMRALAWVDVAEIGRKRALARARRWRRPSRRRSARRRSTTKVSSRAPLLGVGLGLGAARRPAGCGGGNTLRRRSSSGPAQTTPNRHGRNRRAARRSRAIR